MRETARATPAVEIAKGHQAATDAGRRSVFPRGLPLRAKRRARPLRLTQSKLIAVPFRRAATHERVEHRITFNFALCRNPIRLAAGVLAGMVAVPIE